MTSEPNRADRRRGRMKRSRWIAAGSSVGALVLVTAAIAVENPAPAATASGSITSTAGASRATSLGPGSSTGGSDSGWITSSDVGNPAPSSGRTLDPVNGGSQGQSVFDPGTAPGAGRTSSGGS